MFPYAKLKDLQELLKLENKKDAEIFLIRLKGWIDKNGHTKTSLIKGITLIYKQLHKHQEVKKEEELKKIKLTGIKNKILLKYATEILELHKQGLGARKISNVLYELHKAKISHSTIYRFLKAQNG